MYIQLIKYFSNIWNEFFSYTIFFAVLVFVIWFISELVEKEAVKIVMDVLLNLLKMVFITFGILCSTTYIAYLIISNISGAIRNIYVGHLSHVKLISLQKTHKLDLFLNKKTNNYFWGNIDKVIKVIITSYTVSGAILGVAVINFYKNSILNIKNDCRKFLRLNLRLKDYRFIYKIKTLLYVERDTIQEILEIFLKSKKIF